jgi:hypothetical protein
MDTQPRARGTRSARKVEREETTTAERHHGAMIPDLSRLEATDDSPQQNIRADPFVTRLRVRAG